MPPPVSPGWIDVPYAQSGANRLLARLYSPEPGPPLGAMVQVHGGTWTSGDRSLNAVTAQALASAGYLVMALDFRKPPEAHYPEPVADINAGIRWLKEHAGRLGLRPEAVGGVGFSSGGHQLMLSAMNPGDLRYTATQPIEGGDRDAGLAFAVLCYAVLDPLRRYEMAVSRSITMLIERSNQYFGDRAVMREANPQYVVESAGAVALPPICAIQGLADGNLPMDMADRFVDAYRRRGGSAELHTYPETPHGFLEKHPDSPAAQDATAALLRFVRRHTTVSTPDVRADG